MKKSLFAILFVIAAFSFTSCNSYIKSGMAGSTDVMLNRNSDEYTIKRLKPIELEGTSLFGIPGFATNNKNKNKTGMIFKLAGFTLGKTPRIMPILTFLGMSAASGILIQELGGIVNNYQSSRYGQYKINTPVAMLLGVPMGGIINNFAWRGSATSGLTNQMYYRLVDENPEVDIFTNPKYTIDYKQGIFKQSATIKANVMGATLKLK